MWHVGHNLPKRVKLFGPDNNIDNFRLPLQHLDDVLDGYAVSTAKKRQLLPDTLANSACRYYNRLPNKLDLNFADLCAVMIKQYSTHNQE